MPAAFLPAAFIFDPWHVPLPVTACETWSMQLSMAFSTELAVPSHGGVSVSAFANESVNFPSAAVKQASTGVPLVASVDKHLNFPEAFLPDAFSFEAEHFCTGVPPAIPLPSVSPVPSSATATTLMIIFIWPSPGYGDRLKPSGEISLADVRDELVHAVHLGDRADPQLILVACLVLELQLQDETGNEDELRKI